MGGMGGTDVQKTCDDIVMQDFVLERLGSATSGKRLIEDLYERAKETMRGDGGQCRGLTMVSLVLDKRPNNSIIFTFDRGFLCVPYGKVVRKGRNEALAKILNAKKADIQKMPPLQPWPVTKQKPFIIFTFSFPYECDLCSILRFARLHQLCLHDH